MTASTPPWPRLRNVGSVQLMTQLGTELGLTVPQCLAQTGLDIGVTDLPFLPEYQS